MKPLISVRLVAFNFFPFLLNSFIILLIDSFPRWWWVEAGTLCRHCCFVWDCGLVWTKAGKIDEMFLLSSCESGYIKGDDGDRWARSDIFLLFLLPPSSSLLPLPRYFFFKERLEDRDESRCVLPFCQVNYPLSLFFLIPRLWFYPLKADAKLALEFFVRNRVKEFVEGKLRENANKFLPWRKETF